MLECRNARRILRRAALTSLVALSIGGPTASMASPEGSGLLYESIERFHKVHTSKTIVICRVGMLDKGDVYLHRSPNGKKLDKLDHWHFVYYDSKDKLEGKEWIRVTTEAFVADRANYERRGWIRKEFISCGY